MIKLIIILPILFEAISEGLYLRGTTLMKVISKQVQVLLIASWFIIVYLTFKNVLTDFSQLVILYILLRTIVFNYVHNISAGLKLGYIGTVSFVDRIVVLLSFGQFWMIILFQIICGIFSYCILMNKI